MSSTLSPQPSKPSPPRSPTDWFSSDHHFGHANIIKYCNRPFADVTEMREELIRRHNEVVKPGDMCFFLGDFAFLKDPLEVAAILARMNGYKALITGNHDGISVTESLGWYMVKDRVLELHPTVGSDTGPKYRSAFGKYPVTLSHFPHLSWHSSHKGAISLHGHTHGGLSFDPTLRRMDVGVDTHDYYPWSLDEVIAKLAKVPAPVRKHE